MVEVGWLLRPTEGDVIYGPPQRVVATRSKTLSKKAVQSCPAVNAIEARYFNITVPYDLRLRLRPVGPCKYALHIVPSGTSLTTDNARQLVTLMNQSEWRNQESPVVQISTPYVFLADEPVWISQLPPIFGRLRNVPETIICGRFPIDIWPRQLAWAFEWHDPTQDVILLKGTAWFCVTFETGKPEDTISMVRAKLTPELESYQRSIRDVVGFVSGTFNLFDKARDRRPAKLLVPEV